MPDFNSVLIVGRLTRDPEMRFTPTGTAVCNLSVAVNRSFKDKNGEWKKQVTYVEMTVWGKQAENAAQYLHKGSSVLVNGELEQQSWTDKTSGQKRSKLTVRVQRLQFLDKKGDAAAPEAGEPAAETTDDGW